MPLQGISDSEDDSDDTDSDDDENQDEDKGVIIAEVLHMLQPEKRGVAHLLLLAHLLLWLACCCGSLLNNCFLFFSFQSNVQQQGRSQILFLKRHWPGSNNSNNVSKWASSSK